MQAGDLDAGLWLTHARKIWEGVEQGLSRVVLPDEQGITLRAQLMENVYVFSAFKNHSQIVALVRELTGPDGKPRTWNQFLKAVKPIVNDYNKKWLQSEYYTATGMAQMAAKWKQYEARGGKLQYITVGDERVRQSHADIHGTILPVEDPFWESYYPPNGWRCRCTVRWRSSDTPSVHKGIPANVPPEMRFNPGKAGKVFSEKHPFVATLSLPLKRRVLDNLERLKELAPSPVVYTSEKTGATVRVSVFADKTNIENFNKELKAAKRIADKLAIDVRINPLILIKGHKNPEYTINGRLSDLKEVSGIRSLHNGVKNARRKGCTSIVLEVSGWKGNDLFRSLTRTFNKKINARFEEIFLIKGDRVLNLSREELWSFTYKDKLP